MHEGDAVQTTSKNPSSPSPNPINPSMHVSSDFLPLLTFNSCYSYSYPRAAFDSNMAGVKQERQKPLDARTYRRFASVGAMADLRREWCSGSLQYKFLVGISSKQ